jgi:hypothetical protein
MRDGRPSLRAPVRRNSNRARLPADRDRVEHGLADRAARAGGDSRDRASDVDCDGTLCVRQRDDGDHVAGALGGRGGTALAPDGAFIDRVLVGGVPQ